MAASKREVVIAEVRAAIVVELRGTIPPSIDVMRQLRFDKAAERAVDAVERYCGKIDDGP